MVKPFLLISRVYQSYIGYFAQMSSNLVEHPTSMCHSILLILMASGINFLAQTNNKHLLPFFQNHHFDHFHSSPWPQLFTTAPQSPLAPPSLLLPAVTLPWSLLNYSRDKTPFSLSGQPISLSPSTSLLSYWLSRASKALSPLFTPP